MYQFSAEKVPFFLSHLLSLFIFFIMGGSYSFTSILDVLDVPEGDKSLIFIRILPFTKSHLFFTNMLQ